MTTIDELSQAVLEQTEAMVQSANNGELELFNAHKEQRDALIHQLENQALSVEDAETSRDTLIRAKQLNDTLLADLESRQKKLLDERSAIKKGARMRDAYNQNR